MSEHKYFLTGLSKADSIVADQTPFCLTLIPQNVSETSRIGDVVTGTSMEVRFNSFLPVDYAAVRFYHSRFIGFVWKEQSGTGSEPGIADILDPNWTGATSTLKPLQPFNHNKKVSRKILWDKQWCAYADGDSSVTNWTGVGGSGVAKVGKFVINLTKLKNGLNKVYFNPATTVARNHIYAMFITNCAALSTSPNFATQVKYTFVDT